MPTKPPERRWMVRSAEDLGRAIAGVREVRGLTQAQLAEATAVNRSYLAALEAGSDALILERALRALRRIGAKITVTLADDATSHE